MIVADAVSLCICGDKRCRSVHIIFHDENGKDVATGAVSIANIPEFIKRLQDAAYEAVVMKEDG